MKKNRDRTIEILRRRFPGKWTYEGASTYARDDGFRAQRMSYCSIGMDGAESYYSRWYTGAAGEMMSPNSDLDFLTGAGPFPFGSMTASR